MKTIPEALAELLPAFTPRGPVRVMLTQAVGRVLAEDVVARRDLPPFDNSAMDGYAVRAAELTGASAAAPVTLPLRGESRAGGPLPPPLEPGAVMRIFTGAPLPAGADAVVMQEETERRGEAIAIRQAPTPRQHVRERAGDLSSGAVALRRGTRLGPGEVGLLASQGVAAVSVARAPRVALLSTGDELRDVSDPEEPGTIVNSNAYALAAQVVEAGGVPWIQPIAPDRLEPIVERLREGLRADVVLSIGGVSVGEYDLIHQALAAVGIEQRFWKVAMKPGKPLSFACHQGPSGGVPVIGLPGNPVSAMVTFEVFVRPGLRRMLGDPRPYRTTAEVALAHEHRRKPGRTELARATLEDDGTGLSARLHPLQGSGSLPSMVGVEALLVLPADRDRFSAGERLTALLLEDPRGSAVSPFGAVGPA